MKLMPPEPCCQSPIINNKAHCLGINEDFFFQSGMFNKDNKIAEYRQNIAMQKIFSKE